MTNTFVLPSWPGSLCACERESVGVAQEARDHSYFRTPSVVNKVHPVVNTNVQPFRSAETVSTSRSERKKRNPPSRQRRSAKRLAEFLEKKKQLATVNSDPPPSGNPAACGENPPLAVSNPGVSTAAETSSSDDASRQVEDSQALATP